MSEAPPADVFYRQLCEHAGIALIGTDRALAIQTFNSAAARMFGAVAERLRGQPAWSVVPEDRRAQAERLLRRALDTGESGELEFALPGADGRLRELSGTTTAIRGEAGTIIGVAVCVRDITNRMQLMDELHEHRKMAALGEMAGAIAHHFNNILGGIITSVDFAEASTSPLTKSRILGQVSRLLSRATELVSSLLAFAEGDRREQALADFSQVVRELVDQYEPIAQRQGINLTLELPPLAAVDVPRIQVTTILRNIIQNAVDAMPEGGTLGIAVALAGESLVTRVTDTGHGVEESALQRIFEPFWSTKGGPGRGEALGLGLAVAHGLIQMIGGSISVSSAVGKGSCFEVILPVDAARRALGASDA